MRTTVHLVRHGEVFNPEHILYGRLPGFHLSELGRAQARVTADHLAERPIGLIVSSPLDRARETAAPLADLTGREIDIDPRLIEADNVFTGRNVGGPRALLGDPRNWAHLRNPMRPSWGEPYQQIAARVLAAAQKARRRVEGTGLEAVCVSHQLPIVCARRRVEGLRLFHDPRRRECGLASVTALHFDTDVVVAVDYVEPAAAVLPAGRGTGA